MKRKGPKAELHVLRRFVAEAEKKFLAPHLTAATLGTPSRDEELDVAAFVVLAHGAIENFVEGIGYWTLESLERSWINKKRASRSLVSLLLYSTSPGDDSADELSVFDNIRTRLIEAKSTNSKSIEKNNGIAPRNLRTIFRPLGIDVPDDPKLTGSLELLVSMRHQWAHQFRFGAKVVKFAADLKKTSDDCLMLAEKLANGARSARP